MKDKKGFTTPTKTTTIDTSLVPALNHENEASDDATKQAFTARNNDTEKDDDEEETVAASSAAVGGLSVNDDDDDDYSYSCNTTNDDNEKEDDASTELAKLAENITIQDDEDENGNNLQTVAKWIRTKSCKNIVVLSGAGVSCSAGIPDFRTPGTGLYDNLEKYNLPFPEAVFDLSFYRSNPSPFLNLAKEIWPGLKYSPTLTHSFIKLLNQKNLLLRNYTQNIDMLEILSGVEEERIVECHGHFRTASCIECGAAYDGDACRRIILQTEEDTTKASASPPICHSCGGYVKPDIVFFGQGLPDRFHRYLRSDLRSADLLIVMGTSLTVAPVSLIPSMVSPRKCKRVLMNNELVGDFLSRGGEEEDDDDMMDVFEEGDCDESVRKLCRMLGWEEELEELNQSTRISAGDGGDGGGAGQGTRKGVRVKSV